MTRRNRRSVGNWAESHQWISESCRCVHQRDNIPLSCYKDVGATDRRQHSTLPRFFLLIPCLRRKTGGRGGGECSVRHSWQHLTGENRKNEYEIDAYARPAVPGILIERPSVQKLTHLVCYDFVQTCESNHHSYSNKNNNRFFAFESFC